MSRKRRLYDFCNAKYQGEAYRQQPEGFGMLLDENFTLIISEWNSGQIGQQTLAIFEDSAMIYGSLNPKMGGMLVYCNHGCVLYGKNNSWVVDCSPSSHILKLEVKPETENSAGSQVKIAEERVYKNQEERVKGLEQMLGGSIPQSYRSYQAFISQSFKDFLPIDIRKKKSTPVTTPKHQKFKHPNSTFTISYKKQSIYMKILERQQKVIEVGYSSDVLVGSANAEIVRKYQYQPNYSSWTIHQQIRNPSHVQYCQFEGKDHEHPDHHKIMKEVLKLNHISASEDREQKNKQSSEQQLKLKQSRRNMRAYFKSSLSFVNKFIDIKPIYAYRKVFEEYLSHIRTANGGRYGQKKIQAGRNALVQERNNSHFIDQNIPTREASFDDIKKQLNRVQNKRTFRTPGRSPDHSHYSPVRNSRAQESRSRSPYENPRQYGYKESSPPFRNTREPRQATQTPSRIERRTKKSSVSNHQLQSQQKKAKQNRYIYIPQTNRNYQEESAKNRGKRTSPQSGDITNLIGTYAELDEQIKKQTPKNSRHRLNLTPHRYSYLKDVQTPKYMQLGKMGGKDKNNFGRH